MPRAAPGLISWNGGEISELAQARVDLDIYARCLSRLENMIPLPQGGATGRPGSRFIAEVRNSAKPAWFINFVFSDDDAVMLVLNDGYIRFVVNYEIVESSPGVAYEIAHPWADADLPLLQWVQSADVLYVACKGYKQRKIARSGTTSWALTTPDFNDGPFLDDNSDSTLAMSFSARTGSITVTMSNPYFESGHVGSLFLVWPTSLAVSGLSPWEPSVTTTVGDRTYYNGRIYSASSVGTSGKTGTVPPIHEEGSRYDGKQGVNVQWAYEGSLYGILRVTGYTNNKTVTATVLKTIPFPLASASTTRWAEGAWNDLNGYPQTVTIYQDRLCFAATEQQPDTLWSSVVGDYLNFAPRDSGGLVTADYAVTVTVASQQVNEIRHLVPDGTGIFALTTGGEYLIGPSTNNEPFSASNVRAIPQTTIGSARVRPAKVGPVTLFLQKGAEVLREAAFAYDNDRYKARDTTILHPYVLNSGAISLAYSGAPYGVLWGALDNGTIAALTYDQDEELTGWQRHTIAGTDAVVECTSTIPSPDGAIDDVFLIVARTIDGATVRYIEYIDHSWPLDGDMAEACYVDSAVTQTGAASTITGLDHLEGETVGVLADGTVHPDCVVSGGSITLNGTYTTRTAGLKYRQRGRSVRIEAGAADGTAQARTKRISSVAFRVFNSLAFLFGTDDKQERTILRDPSMPMSGPVTPLTGDTRRMPWPGGYGTDGYICFEQDQPVPLTILGAWPILDTQEK